MLCADPVMDTGQPCLEISEDEMDDGQELLGHFGIPAFGNGVVIVAELPQAGVTAPIVCDDQRPRSDGAIDKSTKRFGASVRLPSAPFRGIQRRQHRPGRAVETPAATAETAARRAGRCPSESAWAHSYPHPPSDNRVQ